jgi:hypothetical protein
MKKIRMGLFLYVIAFVAVVILGRAHWWTNGIGFTYARDEKTDHWLGLFFEPLYRIGRRFGLRRLSQPFGRI